MPWAGLVMVRKKHALSDSKGRPIAFHLTGANVSDFT